MTSDGENHLRPSHPVNEGGSGSVPPENKERLETRLYKNASETPRRRLKFISYEIDFNQRFISTNLRQQIKYRFSYPIGQAPIYYGCQFKNKKCPIKYHAVPQVKYRLTYPGFPSTLRTSSPCVEPGDLSLLMEAMPFTDNFPLENRLF